MPKFNTKYTTPRACGEENTGELITNPAGYIPKAVMVQRFLQAGENLNFLSSTRTAPYYESETNPDFDSASFNPTTSKGFDVVDAQTLSEQLNQTLEPVMTALTKKQQAAEKKAQLAALKAELEPETNQQLIADPEVQPAYN